MTNGASGTQQLLPSPTPASTTQLADVVSAKVQTETMQADVNAGMDRLQFLQQKDATSFVVTLASTPAILNK